MKERKENGEVFTPMWLVNEMLDKVPSEVWSDKNCKWLDPAVGIGNFPIDIYLRLMEGLKKIIIDKEERKKHILENMIYMIDINDKNINILKKKYFCEISIILIFIKVPFLLKIKMVVKTIQNLVHGLKRLKLTNLILL